MKEGIITSVKKGIFDYLVSPPPPPPQKKKKIDGWGLYPHVAL